MDDQRGVSWVWDNVRRFFFFCFEVLYNSSTFITYNNSLLIPNQLCYEIKSEQVIAQQYKKDYILYCKYSMTFTMFDDKMYWINIDQFTKIVFFLHVCLSWDNALILSKINVVQSKVNRAEIDNRKECNIVWRWFNPVNWWKIFKLAERKLVA